MGMYSQVGLSVNRTTAADPWSVVVTAESSPAAGFLATYFGECGRLVESLSKKNKDLIDICWCKMLPDTTEMQEKTPLVSKSSRGEGVGWPRRSTFEKNPVHPARRILHVS